MIHETSLERNVFAVFLPAWESCGFLVCMPHVPQMKRGDALRMAGSPEVRGGVLAYEHDLSRDGLLTWAAIRTETPEMAKAYIGEDVHG